MPNLRSILRFSKPRRGARACIAIGLALAAIWWVSLGASVYGWANRLGGGVYAGAAHVYVFKDAKPAPARTRVSWTWPNWRAMWWPTTDSNVSVSVVDIPLYPFAVAFLAYGLLRLYRLREIPAHLCTNCRYDRRGIPTAAPCPECGTNPAHSPNPGTTAPSTINSSPHVPPEAPKQN